MTDDHSDTVTHSFFKRFVALDRSTHKDLRIDRSAGFGFARGLITIPLTLSDFPAAARDYPIVFIGEPARPFAVLGLRRGHNLLVDHAGHWRKQRYIPNHLRSYPFGYAEAPGNQIVLCIDEAADHFVPAEPRRSESVFPAGQPSPLINQMLEFLTRLHSEIAPTDEFSAALAEAGLLIERRAEAVLTTGEHLSLDGFRIVDEQTFNSLDDEVALKWRRRGWLAPVYFHLQSMGTLANLIEWEGEKSPLKT